MIAFSQYSINLLTVASVGGPVLQDHPDIPLVIDCLSRKRNHHVALQGLESEKIFLALLKNIALRISESTTPKILRDCYFIFFDTKQMGFCEDNKTNILQAFNQLIELVRLTKKHIIFAVNSIESPCAHFNKLLYSLLWQENWHFLTLHSTKTPSEFTPLKFSELTDSEIITLLKTYKTELELFHEVTIGEEVFYPAIIFTKRYLSNHSLFDKSLELLDSASARASAFSSKDSTSLFKNSVTVTLLADVIASWTSIPVSHLTHHAFNAEQLNQALKQRIFGQDMAIAEMGSCLQEAKIGLPRKQGSLCNFLLVGPSSVGKKTSALAIAEHFFGHKKALLRIDPTDSWHHITEVTITTEENQSISLLTAIQTMPNCVILIENIHHAPSITLSLFKTILTQGFAFDLQGNSYDFRQAIIIMTTTLGSERIVSLIQTQAKLEANKTLDLMDLVLNDHLLPPPGEPHPISIHELYEELTPALESYFPSTLLDHLHIIPYLPLDYATLEKVIRFDLKSFAKRLETQLGIQLNYAPEVIKFLANEALWRKPQTKSLEKIYSNYVYSVIAKEIGANTNEKHSSNRLIMQLNDDGNLLKCEFVQMPVATYV